MMVLLSVRLVYTVALVVTMMTLYSSTRVIKKSITIAPIFGLAVVNAFPLTTRTQPNTRNFHAFHRLGKRQYNMFLGAPSTATTTTTSPAFIHCHYLSSVGGSNCESESDSDTKQADVAPMAFVHQEWTLEQDELLWENQNKLSIEQLASLLGRGLGGVEARLAKLKNVNNAAYQRLFADRKKRRTLSTNTDMDDDDDDAINRRSQKLVPVSEVLRRIQWDYQLDPKDFFVLHYDRVEDKIVESVMDAPNTQISGNAVRFIDALPEHRIVGIKYRERIVWDRERKMDLFFSNDHGIETVIATYDAWKDQKDAAKAATRARQAEVSDKIRMILGLDRFAQLNELSSSLLLLPTKDTAAVSMKKLVEVFVETALDLFRQVRSDPSPSLEPMLIPMSDYQALDTISELAALLPDTEVRPIVLSEIKMAMQRILGKPPPPPQQQPDDEQQQAQVFDKATTKRRPLPEFREEDLSEKFVRGSGAGGQKINKTSNRVVLVHEPTKIRIECQDTRSLQQNRKIARKRLRQKLDEYYHGNQSKASLAAVEASLKKKKALARSRTRQRKRKEAVASSASSASTDSTDGGGGAGDDDDDYLDIK